MSQTATFTIELKDGVSEAADGAVTSLQALEEKLSAGQKQLGAMEAAMRKLTAGGKGASDAAKDLADKITAQKASLASVQEAYVNLGGTFVRASGGASEASGGLAGLLVQAKALPGPLGATAGQLAGMGGPAGIAAAAAASLTAALASLLAVTVATTAALFKYGVAQSNARRAEFLRLEGLSLLPRLYGRARAGGQEMQAAIDRASESTVLGREDLARYGDQLTRLGLRGNALATSLEVVGIAATAAGDQGAAFAQRMLVSAARTGRSIDEVAEGLRGRFGPVASRVMLDFDVQVRRLRQNLDRLFSGLRIEDFLRGVSGVLAVFSQTTVTGRALKTVVESLFQPLVDFVGGPVMLGLRRFFQGLVFGALRFESTVLQLRLALRNAFGPGSVFEGLDGEMLVFQAGSIAVGALVGAVVLAVGAFAALGAIATVVVASLAAPLAITVAAVVGLVVGVRKAYTAIQGIDWAALGRSIIDGIAGGIRSGVSRVTSAVTGAATSVRTAFADALQIRSPSRVFAELGSQIPAGLSVGIEGGAPDVASSVDGLVSVPSRLGAGGASSISIGEIHIHTQGDASSVADGLRDALTRALEGVALEIGAPA